MAHGTPQKGRDKVEQLIEQLRGQDLRVYDVLPILRRTNLPRAFFNELVKMERWIKEYEVQLTLVSNPRTPLHISIRFLKHLYRHDLAKLARNVNVPIAIRRKAENLLQLRLEALPLGDRISIAKSGPNAIACALLWAPERRVVEAVLRNSQLREKDMVQYVNSRKAVPWVLAMLARHRVWSKRLAVRGGLVRNPRTPGHEVYRLMEDLLSPALQEAVQSRKLHVIVRKRARAILESRVLDLDEERRLEIAKHGRGRSLAVLAEKGTRLELAAILGNPNVEDEHLLAMARSGHGEHFRREILAHEAWPAEVQFPSSAPDGNRDSLKNFDHTQSKR